MDRNGPSRCVYTVLIGDYEQLNEQEVASGSDLSFICLTDDPNLTSGSWDVRQVDPTFAMDPIRSQRDLKIRPHVHLPEFDQSLYIDNSVVLKVLPEILFETYLVDSKFALPDHSFRESLIDEFIGVIKLGFDDPGRVFEQLNHYALFDPELMNERPFWSAILLRDHHDAGVRKGLEIWASHVFRYSRRDQLSANMAFRQAGLAPDRIAIDNHESWFHRWPITTGRERFKGMRDAVASISPAIFRLRNMEQEIVETARVHEHERRETEIRLTEEQRARGELSDALADCRRDLEVARGELGELRKAADQLRGDRDTALVELGKSAAREDQLWARYVALRKRSILRLPRWLIRQS
ncbi:hypothetical protein [uncultured Rhodoblastus sp.]|uniref:hypothetical protein n=1 Tax=uncultured Rhodoblastus sp. TaxID=543037 RepID=UPI0025DE1C4D|nr:hypothetical protein [uncultured Rhodoblastus sp.]